MSKASTNTDNQPWFKQFWPWFLIALPAAVVVAGLTTLAIAIKYSDDLVADNYYKEGMAINRRLENQQLANDLGLAADLQISKLHIVVTLSVPVPASTLSLEIYHPLNESMDMSIELQQVDSGIYQGSLTQRLGGTFRWHWSMTPKNLPTEKTWQLTGEIHPSRLPAEKSR